jgi:hypothetical protein
MFGAVFTINRTPTGGGRKESAASGAGPEFPGKRRLRVGLKRGSRGHFYEDVVQGPRCMTFDRVSACINTTHSRRMATHFVSACF